MRSHPLSRTATLFAGAAAALIYGSATADYTIAQAGSATSYTGYTLTFDEPLGPTGVVSPNAWQFAQLVTIDAGDGVPLVGSFGELSGFNFRGNSGVIISFNQDVLQMSFQAWTNAPDGFRIRLLDDGEEVAVLLNPDGLQDGDWFEITTTSGSAFDEMEITGISDAVAPTDIDNLSWNTVYAITQAGSATAYPGETLDFDEPGGPTGSVSPTYWQASHGVTLNDGLLQPVVGVTPQLDGNAFQGSSGVNVFFDRDITEMSFQAWTNAPGGFRIRLFNDAEPVAVFIREGIFPLAFGDWFDMTTTNGVVFDGAEIYGYGGIWRTDIDNLSWNVVSCPADIDRDATTGFSDLTKLLAAWGDCVSPCPADIDNSEVIGFSDLTIILNNWGACP